MLSLSLAARVKEGEGIEATGLRERGEKVQVRIEGGDELGGQV